VDAKINGYNSTKLLDLSEILHMRTMKNINNDLNITLKHTAGQLQFHKRLKYITEK